MTHQQVLEAVEAKFEEVHALVYDEIEIKGTHPLLVEMWEVFEKIKKLAENG